MHSDNSYEPNDGEPGAGKRACRRTLTRRYICYVFFLSQAILIFFLDNSCTAGEVQEEREQTLRAELARANLELQAAARRNEITEAECEQRVDRMRQTAFAERFEAERQRVRAERYRRQAQNRSNPPAEMDEQ